MILIVLFRLLHYVLMEENRATAGVLFFDFAGGRVCVFVVGDLPVCASGFGVLWLA